MTFQHKYLHSLPPAEWEGRHVKRHHITREPGAVLPADIADAAYAIARTLLPPADDETPPAGWIVLHEGKSAMYLCIYSWVWGNAVHARNTAAGEPFAGCPDKDLTSYAVLTEPLTGRVWELPATAHEPTAWVTRIPTPDSPDHAGYLTDTLPHGPIG